MRELLKFEFLRLRYGTEVLRGCILAVLSSLICLAMLKMLQSNISAIPAEWFEILRSGEYYNLGIVKVTDIAQLASPSFEAVVCSAFRGSLTPLIVLAVVGSYICEDFDSGTIKAQVGLDQARRKIYASKLIASAILCITIALATFLSLTLGWFIFWGDSPKGCDAGSICGYLLSETILIVAFAAICVATSFMLKKKSRTLITLFGAVIILPLLLNTVDLLLLRRFDISSWWVINIMSRLAISSDFISYMPRTLLTSAISIILFSICGIFAFSKSNL